MLFSGRQELGSVRTGVLQLEVVSVRNLGHANHKLYVKIDFEDGFEFFGIHNTHATAPFALAGFESSNLILRQLFFVLVHFFESFPRLLHVLLRNLAFLRSLRGFFARRLLRIRASALLATRSW